MLRNMNNIHKLIFNYLLLCLEGIYTLDTPITAPHSIITSSKDTSLYTVEGYGNLAITYIQNKECVVSSIGFGIEIGYLNDPENIQGLNQFVRNIIFSEEEGSFKSFISSHDGVVEGNIRDHYTTYYFDIKNEHLKEAVEKFINAFINMKESMNDELVSRAIKEVHIELQAIDSDRWVYSLLTEMMCTSAIPNGTFCYGKTLKMVEKDEVVKAALDLVYNKYRNTKKTLVIQSNQSLEYMKNIVEGFKKISNAKENADMDYATINEESLLDEESLSEIRNIMNDVFEDTMLSRIIYCEPNMKSSKKTVRVFTILPVLDKYFKTNPFSYIEAIFRRHDHNNMSFNFQKHGKYIFLEIRGTLNLNANIFEFLSKAYSCLESLKVDEKLYNSLKNRIETGYIYSTQMEMTIEIALNMFKYPLKYIIGGKDVFEEYDASVIKECILSILDPEKWIILVEDPNINLINSQGMMIERYGGIRYVISSKVDEISYNIIKGIKCRGSVNKKGRKMKKSLLEDGELNFVYDTEIEESKVFISIVLASDDARRQPVIYYLYFRLILCKFTEIHAKQPQNNKVNISTNICKEGIEIEIEGAADCAIGMTEQFFNCIDDDSIINSAIRDTDKNVVETLLNTWFNSIRNELEIYFKSIVSKEPYDRTIEWLRTALAGDASSERNLEATKCVKLEDVKIERKFFIKMTAVGESSYKSIEWMFSGICSRLGTKKAYSGIKIATKSTPIVVRVQNSPNKVVNLFYEVNKPRDDAQCSNSEIERMKRISIAELIVDVSRRAFFKHLKDIIKPGNLFSVNIIQLKSAQYVSFSIQSDERIWTIKKTMLMILEIVKNIINSMSGDDFEGRKVVLAGKYHEPWTSLRSFCRWIGDSLEEGNFDMNKRKKISEAVMKLEKKDILDFFNIWNFFIEVKSNEIDNGPYE